jgi:hypothetical protein
MGMYHLRIILYRLFNPPPNPLVYVNQPNALVAREGYHVIVTDICVTKGI